MAFEPCHPWAAKGFEIETDYPFVNTELDNSYFAVNNPVDRLDQKSAFAADGMGWAGNRAAYYSFVVESDTDSAGFGSYFAADSIVVVSSTRGASFAPSFHDERNDLVLVYQTWANISSLSFSITHYEL
jgi:hypothetical protein